MDTPDLQVLRAEVEDRDSKADDGRAKEVAVEGNRKLTTFGQRLMLVANQTNTKLKTWSWREERAARRKTRPVSKQTPHPSCDEGGGESTSSHYRAWLASKAVADEMSRSENGTVDAWQKREIKELHLLSSTTSPLSLSSITHSLVSFIPSLSLTSSLLR